MFVHIELLKGFIEKNRDKISEELFQVLLGSGNAFLRGLIAGTKQSAEENSDSEGRLRQKKKASTIGNVFRVKLQFRNSKESLNSLMQTIYSTNAHYVRCIKPNDTKKAFSFQDPMVLEQLQACGVLETLRISTEGFPSKWIIDDFVNRYFRIINQIFDSAAFLTLEGE